MKHIEAENAVFKYAACFLSKRTIDTVAQFADKRNIYALVYSPLSDRWGFTGCLILSTKEVIELES